MTFPCPNLDQGELAAHTELIRRMHTIARKDKKLVTSKEYSAPARPDIKIRSWNAKESMYYVVPCPFPTLARGMFTEWLPAHDDQAEGTDGGQWRIVARGYDKFFNIGETSWMNWTSLETHTVAPYHLTLKSNGCIIFVAALTQDKLLVTSKHSLGPLANTVSHATIGEQWLDKHLAVKGRTQADFAATLWDKNWTAVFELCDDSFEEHVLPIPKDKTGLHLHGINSSQPQFHTQSPDFLQTFAKEWGFIETAYLTLDTIEEVKKFTEECSKTGSWNGEAIEGFVVRTRVGSGQSQTQNASDRSAPPYPSGSDMFFKVKFDEPYMMYRDFREITKSLLSKGSIIVALQSKLRRKETRVYRDWVEGEIKRDRKQFEGFTDNHGIIATRERFCEWLTTPAGQQRLAEAKDIEDKKQAPGTEVSVEASTSGAAITTTERQRWAIVPVAVPGSGKTAIAIALSHLFGFGHTQSDDVKDKKPAPVFLSNVVKAFDHYDVVFADKNNHLLQHRGGLKSALANIHPPVKLLGLNWAVTNLPSSTVLQICSDRILARGENHQSLVPTADVHHHEDILRDFLQKAKPLAEVEVDATIEMDIEEGLEESLARAVDGVCKIMALERPSQEMIGEALRLARGYQAKRGASASKAAELAPKKDKNANQPPRYYAFLPEAPPEKDFAALTEQAVLKPDAPALLKETWERARKIADQLITDRPHVTIVHKNGLGDVEERGVWDACKNLAPGATFRLTFDRLVFNGRIIAVVATGLRAEGDDTTAGSLVTAIPERISRRFHVTVARRDGNVAAVEAKALVEKWRRNPSNVKTVMFDEPFECDARMMGLIE
ncbi:RNA ligase-domain-containing protein [Auriculariales sp. MPI-PUGE-AT-0066]|nr:RNA ligase-domain-containing protein [Auriculariales sp. MPI-PUGE-AT-0066]